ncbi:hypothetical protein D8B26_007713 [Coccidioides posadasii str. Silveira]|uniref:Uncharacterized protein n=3 Tax=Coccidioides posadasii TaxID=199306 RepID=E9D2S4_COCPS|nr:hypothetical protein CPC735_017130 [Coccidioides posadasii C735 delta SOWgp]EER25111.1 hypothetical protein CPC735_017130 [Coccidioides posadasii C735 delta SOWgp]EFW19488.1 hypothetical protein CPSG_03872 [Coccidioides posadasii str. Silveira]KMM71949.1 hypothetical protein CPAG_08249 [Coccidioides posadasii RMSCC 3488]QVM13097.1 hypothetical protein D8B26_007713 [Coccidioides posadasii str. Silveira]|eukprot:XP_003067256.1 hypothetical protein CPC735_017130 [Coccidioides posadasii C735 delta SOWgp]
MAAKIAGALSKKVLKESAENRFGQEDPYFEEVSATNLLGRPTTRRRRKAAPEGISENDAKVLTKVKRRAYRLDLCLCNCCGIKFGWSSVIALVPAFGDALDMVLALMVVRSCSNIDGGLPGSLYLHMLLNVAFDFAIGLVPFVGDLADALYKCNTRNAVLLEKYLKEKGKQNLKRQNQGTIEMGDGVQPGSGQTTPRMNQPRRPEHAHIPRDDGQPGNSGRSGRIREPDLEMGIR